MCWLSFAGTNQVKGDKSWSSPRIIKPYQPLDPRPVSRDSNMTPHTGVWSPLYKYWRPEPWGKRTNHTFPSYTNSNLDVRVPCRYPPPLFTTGRHGQTSLATATTTLIEDPESQTMQNSTNLIIKSRDINL